MGLHKILKIVAAVLGIIGVVLAGIVWSLDGDALITELKAVNGNVGEMDIPGSLSNIINVAFVVLGIVLVLVIVFVLKGLFTGNAKNALIGIGAFALIVAISYFMAPSSAPEEVMNAVKEGEVLTTSSLKWIGAGINAFYILAVAAIGIMFFTGAKKLIK